MAPAGRLISGTLVVPARGDKRARPGWAGDALARQIARAAIGGARGARPAAIDRRSGVQWAPLRSAPASARRGTVESSPRATCCGPAPRGPGATKWAVPGSTASCDSGRPARSHITRLPATRRARRRSAQSPPRGVGLTSSALEPACCSPMNAIVTGASRGLGLALTRALSERGWRLAVDARTASELAAATAGLDGVTAIPGDVADPRHRAELVAAAGEPVDLLVNNASLLGPSPQPGLADYPLDELRRVYEVNVLAPLAFAQLVLPRLGPRAAMLDITSDAAVEPYEGWGGYGSSKAALDQLTAILGAENPGLRIYAVDPGDMRTVMQQQAFPGEDVSDRPPPEAVVPALLELIEGSHPSGRYRAHDLVAGAR